MGTQQDNREGRPALDLRHHAELASTQDEALRLARAGAAEGTGVWADRQIAGRGRRGRGWESPEGNLYLSVVVRPALAVALAGRLGVACGLGVARCLTAICGLPIRPKWPNDLYLAGRKVGGILVETGAASGGGLSWAVVGVGLNVAWAPDVAPPAQPATSLAAHGIPPPLDALARAVVEAAVQACADVASDTAWRAISDGWAAQDLAAGPVRVIEGDVSHDAEGIRVDDDGALVVRVGSVTRRVTAGEVTVRV